MSASSASTPPATNSEFWSARNLAHVLDYTDFRNFIEVITKARQACANSGHTVSDHFIDINEMVSIGSGTQRAIEDWSLSRYACYLVIQNADPSKLLVALGQSYSAVQTRRQELADDETLKGDKMRLLLRAEMRDEEAQQESGGRGEAGGRHSAIGLRHLHGSRISRAARRTRHARHPQRKMLKVKEHVLGHMSSTELAPNLFRATSTEERLRRENVRNKDQTNRIHGEAGRKVGKTIHELGGPMPENLPVAESIKKVESREQKRLNDG